MLVRAGEEGGGGWRAEGDGQSEGIRRREGAFGHGSEMRHLTVYECEVFQSGIEVGKDGKAGSEAQPQLRTRLDGDGATPRVAASWPSPGKLCRWQLISVDQRSRRNISHATD